MNKLWSKEEELYLKKHYERSKVNDICQVLGRSRQSVIRKAQRMELGEVRNYNKWNNKQVDYLTKNFNDTASETIADYLGVTRQAVNEKARKLGLKKSREYKRKVMSEALKGNKLRLGIRHTEEAKERISSTMKNIRGKASEKVRYRKIWNSFSEEKKHKITFNSVKAMHKKKKDTTIELMIKDVIEKNNFKYEREKSIGKYRCDFYLPEYNLIVECDGDYWHSLPEVAARDIKKDHFLTEKGYKIARIKECEIRENASFYLEKAIKDTRW